MTRLDVVRGTVAALGAYYLLAAVALSTLLPFQFSLPRFGSIFYPELGVILGIVTAVGSAVAAAIAMRFGGVRAVAVLAGLWLMTVATIVGPFVGEGTRAFVPRSDLTGVMPATVIALSVLVGGPGIAIGALVGGWVFGATRVPPRFLTAAGAYYVTCVVISLPTPQLDVRFMLPFSATGLPVEWHALARTVPAIATGLVLATGALRPWRLAIVGAVLGLAGALPGEVPMLLSPIRPYWPSSLVGVPLLSALVVVVAAYGARTLAAIYGTSRGRELRGRDGLLIGASGVLLLAAVLSLFGAMPSAADRDGPVDEFQRTGDERKLVACVLSERGEDILGSSARETVDAVFVTVRLRRPPSWYFHDLAGIPLPVVVTLHDPLGGRAVIDVRTGRVVREVSRTERTPPFGSWC